MHRMLCCLVALVMCFTSAADAKKKLKDISLEWKSESVDELEPIDLSPFSRKKFKILPFEDLRTEKFEIGKNIEDKDDGIIRKVTTKDDAAAWCTEHFKEMVQLYGVSVTDKLPAIIIKTSLQKLYVLEESTYKGDIRLKIEITSSIDDVLLWEGLITGKASKWGSSYDKDMYYEVLTKTVADAAKKFLTSKMIHSAISGE